MRRIFFIGLLALLFQTNLLAQKAPTFYETIDYINKRVVETVGHQLKWKSGLSQYIIDASFYNGGSSYNEGKYKYRYSKKDNTWYSHYYSFKPEHIISVAEGSANTTTDSPVGFISISCVKNLVKEESRSWYHYGGSYVDQSAFHNSTVNIGNVSTVYIPYLKQDPTAFERIKKAILHLKSLSADSDPFAN
jgi:hypothetical protein